MVGQAMLLSFYHFLNVAKSKYSQKDSPYQPYHFIIPSLPRYVFTSGPSVKKEWNNEDIAFVMNELMVGLGFSGCIAHCGDIGSFISRNLAVKYDGCKAIHLNFCLMAEHPKGIRAAEVTDEEKKNLNRLVAFDTTGIAYAKQHGTKGGTTGLALFQSACSVVLDWGEVYEWTDQTPSTQQILDSVMLYWVTDTFRRCICPSLHCLLWSGR